MEKTIRKRQGYDGLMVKVEASISFPGSYDVSVFRPGWVGTMSSKDGIGWMGAGFRGTKDEIGQIIQVILRGIEKERKAVEKVVTKYAEKKLDEVV